MAPDAQQTKAPIGKAVSRVFKSLADPANSILKFVGFFIAISGVCTYLATNVFRTELTPLLIALCVLSGAVLTLFIAMFRLVWQDETNSQNVAKRIQNLQAELKDAQDYRGDVQTAAELKYKAEILQLAFDSKDADTFFNAIWNNVLVELTKDSHFQVHYVRRKRYPALSRNTIRLAGRQGITSYDATRTFDQQVTGWINTAKSKAIDDDIVVYQGDHAHSGIRYTQITWLYHMTTAGDVWYVFAFYLPGTKEGPCRKEYEYIHKRLAQQIQLSFGQVAARQSVNIQPSKREEIWALLKWLAEVRASDALKRRITELESANDKLEGTARDIRLQLKMTVIDEGSPESGTNSDQLNYKKMAHQIQDQKGTFATRPEKDAVHFAIPIVHQTEFQNGKGVLGTIRAIYEDSQLRSLRLVDGSDLTSLSQYLQSNVADAVSRDKPDVRDGDALAAYHQELAQRPLNGRLRVLYHLHIHHRARPSFWDEVKREHPALIHKVQTELWARARMFDRPLIVDDGHGHYFIAGLDTSERDLVAIKRDGMSLRQQILPLIQTIDKASVIRVGVFRCCEHTGKSLTADEWQKEVTRLSTNATNRESFVGTDDKIIYESGSSETTG